MIGIMATLLGTSGFAASLDIGNTSSTGCGEEWADKCLPNLVWGGAARFGAESPTSVPVLTIGAASGAQSSILVSGIEKLGSADYLRYIVRGQALTSSSKVKMQTRFYNSSNTLIATHTDVLHSAAAGLFSVEHQKTNIPSAATTWQIRLIVRDDAATFFEVSGDTGEDPDHKCEECSENCSDYTALGYECPPDYSCSAECYEYDVDDLAFHSGVNL